MELITQVVMLATAVVGMATSIVKAMAEARGVRPDVEEDRQRK